MTDEVNDGLLLAALDNALAAARSVSGDLVAMGKACFAWHGIDAELAQLVHDSFVDTSLAAATRSEPAQVRALTFVARNLRVELEVTGEGLRGQLIPHQAGEVELELPRGHKLTAIADRLGYFVFGQTPTTSFRLHCRTLSEGTVSTTWVTL